MPDLSVPVYILATVAKPGDTIILGLHNVINPAQAQALKLKIQDKVPDVRVVIVDGVSAMTIVRDETSNAPR